MGGWMYAVGVVVIGSDCADDGSVLALHGVTVEYTTHSCGVHRDRAATVADHEAREKSVYLSPPMWHRCSVRGRYS